MFYSINCVIRKGGNVLDSVEFVLTNFTEMNKLWVRLQHQGPAKERERRESERTELQLLVGKSIAKLAQLEGVDLELYSKVFNLYYSYYFQLKCTN